MVLMHVLQEALGIEIVDQVLDWLKKESVTSIADSLPMGSNWMATQGNRAARIRTPSLMVGKPDTDPGRGTSRVVSQSRIVEPNHGCDSTGARGGASFENRSAGVPIPAVLSDNQYGALYEEDD